MKFTAEISDTETIFLDTVVYQGTTFNEKWEKAIIDAKTHFKRKSSSLYIFTSYHPPIIKRDLTNKKPWESTNKLLWGSISDFKNRLMAEAGHTILKEKLLLEVTLTEGKQRSWNKTTRKKEKYCLSWHNIKEALMKKCNHIQNQPLPCQILKEPLNPRTYAQNHSPTMVQEGGGGRWNPSPEFLICCSISKRFCLHWKAFALLNKMRYILLMVALLEACDVINNGRHVEFYQKW